MANTDIFDRVASEYDNSERIRIAKLASDAIREGLVDTKDKKAIDFGCGTGLVGLNLLDDFNSILFMDSSHNMIDQIKQKTMDLNIENADTLCFDLEQESLPELHADYIFMVQVLLHIPDIEPVISRLYDVLNPGGHLIIIDFNKEEEIVSDLVHNGFDQEELMNLMTKLGYKNNQFKTFYHGTNIFMNHDASMFILDGQKAMK